MAVDGFQDGCSDIEPDPDRESEPSRRLDAARPVLDTGSERGQSTPLKAGVVAGTLSSLELSPVSIWVQVRRGALRRLFQFSSYSKKHPASRQLGDPGPPGT